MTRLVVIEDEHAIRRGITDALRASGYEVAEAADGQRGLDEAIRPGVDLVLLDLMLPRRSGLDVLTELRKSRRERAVSREELLTHIWGIEPTGLETRTVDMHIARLRTKLRDPSGRKTPEAILTVRATGYMAAPDLTPLEEQAEEAQT